MRTSDEEIEISEAVLYMKKDKYSSWGKKDAISIICSL